MQQINGSFRDYSCASRLYVGLRQEDWGLYNAAKRQTADICHGVRPDPNPLRTCTKSTSRLVLLPSGGMVGFPQQCRR